MKHQDMKPFHPHHCGFALRGFCPDPTCPKKEWVGYCLRLLVLEPVGVPVFAPSSPNETACKQESWVCREKASPQLGLIWWEWYPVDGDRL